MASLVHIWFTLVLVLTVIIAVEMVPKVPPKQCGTAPPIEGLFVQSVGVCYIQLASSLSGCITYNCAEFVTAKSTSQKHDGLSTLRERYSMLGYEIQNYFVKQLNQDFTLHQKGVGQPVALVQATNTKTNKEFVQSVVYKDAIGVIVFMCPRNNLKELQEAFICTFKKIPTDDELKVLKKQVKTFNLKPMTKIDHVNCN